MDLVSNERYPRNQAGGRMNPSFMTAQAVADAIGVDHDCIRAFPELVRQGRLPQPVDTCGMPKHPTGWRWNLQDIASTCATNRHHLAKAAEDLTREIHAGASHKQRTEI